MINLRNVLLLSTILMVTHDIDQARRVADYVIFLWLGEVVEHGPVT